MYLYTLILRLRLRIIVVFLRLPSATTEYNRKTSTRYVVIPLAQCLRFPPKAYNIFSAIKYPFLIFICLIIFHDGSEDSSCTINLHLSTLTSSNISILHLFLSN